MDRCNCAKRDDGTTSVIGAAGCPIHGLNAVIQENEDLRQIISELGMTKMALDTALLDVRIHRQNRCPDCKGTREIILNPKWPKGELPYSEKCSTCGGTGRVYD